MDSLTEFTVAEAEGLDYLRSEIGWHRKAGQYLATTTVAGIAVSAGLFRGAFASGSFAGLELIPLIPAVAAIVVGGSYLWVYYRRIAKLKSVCQFLIELRIPDTRFRDKWWEAFLPWRSSKRTAPPELPQK